MSAATGLWSAKFTAWQTAREEELGFQQAVLDPADAAGSVTAAMERQGERLQALRCDRETDVFAVPACNAEQLATKLLIAFDDGREADAYLPVILDDARRFASDRLTRGRAAVAGAMRVFDAGHRGWLNERNSAVSVADDMFVSNFDADFACSRANILETLIFGTSARTDDDVIAKLIAFAQVVMEGNEPSEELATTLVAEASARFGMGAVRQPETIKAEGEA